MNNTSQRMLSYYPKVIEQIKEYQALQYANGEIIESLIINIENGANEACLTTMDVLRIEQWEHLLNLSYDDDETVEDRRDKIIARLNGNKKLNTSSINSIVKVFTEGSAECRFENSTIYVDILPPPNQKRFKFDNVVTELEARKPAHLSIVVTAKYSTWDDIKTHHTDWNAVKNYFDDWDDVRLIIYERE